MFYISWTNWGLSIKKHAKKIIVIQKQKFLHFFMFHRTICSILLRKMFFFFIFFQNKNCSTLRKINLKHSTLKPEFLEYFYIYLKQKSLKTVFYIYLEIVLHSEKTSVNIYLWSGFGFPYFRKKIAVLN